MTAEIFGIYVILGIAAGILAGLLGIGGGLVIVPVLAWTFAALDFHEPLIMHMAVATSLATVFFTAVSSAWAHHSRGSVRWDVVARLAPGIVTGALLAGWGARHLGGVTLRLVFGAFACVAALHMALGRNPAAHRNLPGPAVVAIAGAIIGALSTLVGIGGGTLTVPFLAWCRVDMRTAVGSSAACGVPIAAAGVMAMAVAGAGLPGLPPHATGYVYWPAALAVALASIFAAPIGARLAHVLPVPALRRAFAVLLAAMGIRLITGG